MRGSAAASGGGSPPVDGVLCDLYGTLIPTGDEEARTRSLTEMARLLDLDPTAFVSAWTNSFDDRVRGKLGSLEETVERLATSLGSRPSRTAVDRAVRIRLEFSRRLLDLAAPTLPALDELRAAGVRLAVVSDASEETVRLWPDTALAARVGVAVFSCVEGVRKPHPRMYRAALERLDLPAAKCAFVGDGGSRELSGAEAVGLSTFRYLYPDEDPNDAFRVDPDTTWTGPTLSDLRDLVRLPGPSRPRGAAP